MLEISHKQSTLSYLHLMKKVYENSGIWMVAHNKTLGENDIYSNSLSGISDYKFALKIDNTNPNLIKIVKYVTQSDVYDFTYVDNNSNRQYVKILDEDVTNLEELKCRYSLLIKTMIDFSDVDIQQFSSVGEYKTISLVYLPSESRNVLYVGEDYLNTDGFLIASSTVTTDTPNTFVLNSMDKLQIEFYIDFILDKDGVVTIDNNCDISLIS